MEVSSVKPPRQCPLGLGVPTFCLPESVCDPSLRWDRPQSGLAGQLACPTWFRREWQASGFTRRLQRPCCV